jgi:hypothetical protein
MENTDTFSYIFSNGNGWRCRFRAWWRRHIPGHGILQHLVSF